MARSAQDDIPGGIGSTIFTLGKSVVSGVAEFAIQGVSGDHSAGSLKQRARIQWGPSMPPCVVRALSSNTNPNSSTQNLNDLFDTIVVGGDGNNDDANSVGPSLEKTLPTSDAQNNAEIGVAVKLLWHMLKVRAGELGGGLGGMTERAVFDLVVFNGGNENKNETETEKGGTHTAENCGYDSSVGGGGSGGNWVVKKNTSWIFVPPPLPFPLPLPLSGAARVPSNPQIDSPSFAFRPIPNSTSMLFRLLRHLPPFAQESNMMALLTLFRVGGFKYGFGVGSEARVCEIIREVRQLYLLSKNTHTY